MTQHPLTPPTYVFPHEWVRAIRDAPDEATAVEILLDYGKVRFKQGEACAEIPNVSTISR